MNSEQEVVRIGKQLEKIVNSEIPNDEQALDLLKSLQGIPMTLDVLQKSRVGMSVNKLRKKCDGSNISSVAKKLVKSWKKLLRESEVASTSKPSPTHVQSPMEAETQGNSAPPTPPPVAYSPSPSSGSNTPLQTPVQPSAKNNSSSSKNNTITSSTAPSACASTSSMPLGNGNGDSKNGNGNGDGNGGTKAAMLRRVSSTSEDLELPEFSSLVDGNSRAVSTGDPVRDKCRDMLFNSLKKGFPSISIVEEIKFHNLAAMIEDAIFSELRDTGNKYKMRVRSRFSNLGDVKNPELKRRVITGMITPDRIATMTTDEMASEDMKELRKQFTKESIRDAQLAMRGGTKSGLLKCPKCRKNNCTYTQAQTRSADEPMTTFAFCNECGYRWKFC